MKTDAQLGYKCIMYIVRIEKYEILWYPWYVLVSGIYASKDEAKRAVATLPADVQAKNPWAKPLHQVQADLK